MTYDNVELKSDGEHKLLATVLTKKTATEEDASLGDLEVKVSCKNERN